MEIYAFVYMFFLDLHKHNYAFVFLYSEKSEGDKWECQAKLKKEIWMTMCLRRIEFK